MHERWPHVLKLLRQNNTAYCIWSVCCFVWLDWYWGIITFPGFPRVNRLQIITWGGRILTFHLDYVAGYTDPLLFLFERTQQPTAHTVKVITVHFHSVGCLQPTPSSEWLLEGPHLISPFTQWAACSPHLLRSDSSKAAPHFTLSLSDSSKPAPHFTVLSVKCNWSRIQSKKSCTHQDSVKKILPSSQFVS